MIQNVAKDIGNSPLFGIVSVCLFFAVFIGALIFAFAQKKSLCKTMSTLPLEDGERTEGSSHE